jgi:DNA-binding transcriptional LysR family regulator
MSYQAARAVADKQLVALLRQETGDPSPVHLIHAPQPLLPVKLRAFLDFVAPRLKIALDRIEDTYA